MTDREFRGMALDDAELRESGKTLTFTGYASVFDYEYDIVDHRGAYTEVIRPGAFARCLGRDPDVKFLVNHAGIPLARTLSGTMVLAEDKRGLLVTAHLDPTTSEVQSIRSAMQRGDMDEMSFGFRIPEGGEEWNARADGRLRQVRAADIHKGDVSVVTYGASDATAGASLRGMVADWRSEQRTAMVAALIAADPSLIEGFREASSVKEVREAAAEALEDGTETRTEALAAYESLARAQDAEISRILRRYSA